MWFFGSQTASSSPANSGTSVADAAVDTTFDAQATAPTAPSTRQTRQSRADAEFSDILASLEKRREGEQHVAVAPMPAVGGVAPPTAEPEQPAPICEPEFYTDGTTDIRPEVMHPRTMSCRQAFDQAFYCQSFGGKFNDIYRFGHLQSCDEQWKAFWLCMRARTLGDEEKSRQIVDYYIKREERRKKEHGSSEDVWPVRTRSVERAFWKDLDEISKPQVADG